MLLGLGTAVGLGSYFGGDDEEGGEQYDDGEGLSNNQATALSATQVAGQSVEDTVKKKITQPKPATPKPKKSFFGSWSIPFKSP